MSESITTRWSSQLCLIASCVFILIAPGVARSAEIIVGYLGLEREQEAPLSPLDEEARDEGLKGVELAVEDNSTTDRFFDRDWGLRKKLLIPGRSAQEAVRLLKREGVSYIVSDLDKDELLEAASAEPQLLFFNIRSPDDALRGSDCRDNILHTIPSHAMLADALAQFSAARDWRRWFLIRGKTSADSAYANALTRAASRFGIEIVEEKLWTLVLGKGRADSGHVTLEAEIPVFTRAPDYDLLVVADEADEFGDYLIGRSAAPRLVAGTQGLQSTAWSAVQDQWGARQLQNRFLLEAHRRMTAVDYAGWVAVRALGEAITRNPTLDPKSIKNFLKGPDFVLAGYKGVGLSFRPWDGQLRQPILIAGPRLLVSVSPQPGFLHPQTSLDTLGYDKEESECAR